MKPDIGDALFVGGSAALIYGLALIYAPAAWIAGGSLAMFVGVRLPRVNNGDRGKPV